MNQIKKNIYSPLEFDPFPRVCAQELCIRRVNPLLPKLVTKLYSFEDEPTSEADRILIVYIIERCVCVQEFCIRLAPLLPQPVLKLGLTSVSRAVSNVNSHRPRFQVRARPSYSPLDFDRFPRVLCAGVVHSARAAASLGLRVNPFMNQIKKKNRSYTPPRIRQLLRVCVKELCTRLAPLLPKPVMKLYPFEDDPACEAERSLIAAADGVACAAARVCIPTHTDIYIYIYIYVYIYDMRHEGQCQCIPY